jgi:hypothetical protein
MNKTMILLLLFAFFTTNGFAQVLISDARPDASMTLKPGKERQDTVYVVLKDRVVLGIKKTKTYECIYEKTGLHEREKFEGDATFFIQNAGGLFNLQVTPIAWRVRNAFGEFAEPILWSKSTDWNNAPK